MTLTELIEELFSEIKAETADVKYPWQESVKSALQETDAIKRPARIAHAETVVYARRLALSHEGSNEEHELIEVAINQLASLRGDRP
jgi:hypothetical protein